MRELRISHTANDVRYFFRLDSGRHKGIDFLQDIFQGWLQLGAWPVNSRADSEYNYGILYRFRRLAGSKGTAITEKAMRKAPSVNLYV